MAAPLLRLRSDEQLVALFRAGSDDAFRTIHDRYRVRLLAYARQMLGGSTADAEDALQEVFVRAHAALLASSTPISLRAWLYRIAHNRCVDQLRRPSPIPSEIMPGAEPALSPGHRHDPPAAAERSEQVRRLVADVYSLPAQQRSALLMRELQGLSYDEMSVALGISVAAVKSVLLRARGGVLDAAEARDAPCAEIRLELVSAHDRGVRASGRARRHMRECDHCCGYRGELRAMRREVAGLVPVGPLGLLFGGGGAGGGLAAGGSGAALGGAAATAKVAALVCCAALVGTTGAFQSSSAHHRRARAARAATVRRAPAPAPRVVARLAGGTIAPAPPPAPATAAAAPRRAAVAPALGAGGGAGPALTGQDSYSTDGPSLGLTSAGALASAGAGTGAGGTIAPADTSSASPAAPDPGATPTTASQPAGIDAGSAAAVGPGQQQTISQTTGGDGSQTAQPPTAPTTSSASAPASSSPPPSAAAPVARTTSYHGFHHWLGRRATFAGPSSRSRGALIVAQTTPGQS